MVGHEKNAWHRNTISDSGALFRAGVFRLVLGGTVRCFPLADAQDFGGLAGQTVGCIAMFVLAFLVSPFGLPALGGWLVERLHGVKYAAMDFMAS